MQSDTTRFEMFLYFLAAKRSSEITKQPKINVIPALLIPIKIQNKNYRN